MAKLYYQRFDNFDDMPNEVFSQVRKMNCGTHGHFYNLCKLKYKNGLKYAVVLYLNKEIIGWAAFYNYWYVKRFASFYIKRKYRKNNYLSALMYAMKKEFPSKKPPVVDAGWLARFWEHTVV